MRMRLTGTKGTCLVTLFCGSEMTIRLYVGGAILVEWNHLYILSNKPAHFCLSGIKTRHNMW